MPKARGHTPPWLCRPAAGAKIFSDPEPQSPVSPSKRASYFGNAPASSTAATSPKKLLASRGSEIFTVVGNKIRWANLSKVKDEWEDRRPSKQVDEGQVYRTLITPVYYQITQLVISPSELFLAICTEHTVHVAVLPDSSRLADKDHSPLKLKTYQLGPTTHVIPESPLASVLWHPLAASTDTSDCLITVTAEAAVRVWEIDRTNHWSFERPALGIDLRKLVDGTSADQDFEPLGFGKNRGFSVDAFDMEVSAACFGGLAMADEDGWASMTLWTAMSNGDVYALCPLLPSKWRPSATTIPSLSISAVSNLCALEPETTERDVQKAAEQQFEWVQEIDSASDNNGRPLHDDFRYRPHNPSAIPRLQGPFEVTDFDTSIAGEVADIHVIAARLDEDELLSGEDDYEAITDGLRYTIVALSTTAEKIMVALELEGVSGQWLPQKGRSTFSVPIAESHDLVLLEELSISKTSHPSLTAWPTFTTDPEDPYNVYITTSELIWSVSLRDWSVRVGAEVYGQGEVDSGLQTRLAVSCQDKICEVQQLLTLEDSSSSTPAASSLSSPAVLNELNLGRMLLSSIHNQAHAVLLDESKLTSSIISTAAGHSISPFRSSMALARVLEDDLPDPPPTRAPYTPSETLYKNQMIPLDELKHRIPAARRSILTESPLRLSPACLDMMTVAHRTFSQQTTQVEKAAAELFRRCERLRQELADQLKQMSELADRLQHVNASRGTGQDSTKTFEGRLSSAQLRQKQLLQRYEAVRRKSGRIGTANKELSSKEHGWINEIEMLALKTGVVDSAGPDTDTMQDRYSMVQKLAADLLDQGKQISNNPPSPQKDSTNGASPSIRSSTLSISSRLQKERVAEVMSMVEREGVIIDAVLSRLNKLNVG